MGQHLTWTERRSRDRTPGRHRRRSPGHRRSTVATAALLIAGLAAVPVPALAQTADSFVIAYGDTVSDGVPGPGAGNLEVGGATDSYSFDATAGDVAIFAVLAGATTMFRWRLEAPDGTEVFDVIYTDRQATLDQTGTYTLTVFGFTPTSFGVYSFTLREVPPNQPPVAVDDEVETDHDTPVTIDVLANDSDPDGDTLTVDTVGTPANGTATHTSDQVTYTPDPGFAGTDTFTYTVTDGHGGAAQATVTVTVHEPPNNPPDIAGIDDQVNTVGDTVHLQVQASDPDGDPLTHTATGLPDGLTIDPDTGLITGSIADGADADSPYTVQVTVTDPDGATATTSFTWTVEPAEAAVVSVDIEIVPPVIVSDGHGVIPVVIFGNADVAGNQIDPATVRLEGMPVARLLGLWLTVRCDVDHDGATDLLVLIDDVAGAIPPGSTTATLTGETFGGTSFEGTDHIILLWW